MHKYLIIILSLLLASNSFAQSAGSYKESDKAKTLAKDVAAKDLVAKDLSEKANLIPEPVIKTGVIASTAVNKKSGAIAIGAVTNEQNARGEKVAISGGVSNNNGKCSATITNANEEKDYRVRFRVKGLVNGKRSFSKSFAGKVSKSGKLVKEFKCKEKATLQLNLLSAKPLG